MRALALLLALLLPAGAAAKNYGSAPTGSASSVKAGSTIKPPRQFLNFSTGLTVTQTGTDTVVAVSGGAPVPATRTIATTSPLRIDAGASADLSANRTLSCPTCALTTTTLTAGAGLTGGGDLSAGRTFAVGAGDGITVNADDIAVDSTVVRLGATQTLTDKTLTAPILNGIVTTTGLTLPPFTAAGAIAMGTNKITGLGQGTGSGEALHAGRAVNTSAPLGGGGALTGDLTLTCATCVITSGSYADPAWITSLASSKLTGQATAAQGGTGINGAGGSANRVLRTADGATWTAGQVVLTTDVTGVSPVANGGTNSNAALNNNRIMVSSGGAIVEAAALSNGQILIGSTGAAPVVASLTAGTNITITPGAGTITISASGGGKAIYGDGSDGDATFDGANPVTGATRSGSTYTLDRDVFYDDVTIANGVRVRGVTAAGEAKRMFAAGTITGTGTAQIDWNGNDASGANAGAQIADGVLGGGQAGGAGGTAGGAGSSGQSQTGSALGGNGGNGGAADGGGGGGGGGSHAAPAVSVGGLRSSTTAVLGHFVANATITIAQGGSGGGGGGADGANAGGGGGSGATSGVLAARVLAGTLAIQAKGGAGAPGTAGNAGGGGGGGGGVLALVYDTKGGSVTTSVAGGALGAKAGSGFDGTAGSAGTLIEIANQ